MMKDSDKDRLEKDQKLKDKAQREIRELLGEVQTTTVDKRKLTDGLKEVQKSLELMDFFDKE